MNEILKAMKERRSVRAFKSELPPRELLDAVVEAGVYAASGHGAQSPIVLAVTNPELMAKLRKDNCKIGGWGPDFDPFYGAPAALIVLADKSAPTHVYDGALVMGNMMLAAHSLGLATCWIHRAKKEFETPDYKALLKSLGVEGDYEGIGHCAIGYAAKAPGAPAPRKANRVYRID